MRDPGEHPTLLSGVNAEFLEHLFQRYLEQPTSVDPEWQRFFAELQNGHGNGHAAEARGTPTPPPGSVQHREGYEGEVADLSKQSAVFQLINSYRTFGHTHARLDPLGHRHMPNAPDLSPEAFGLDSGDVERTFSTGTLVAPPLATLREILEQVEHTYCRTVGVEYMPIRDVGQRRWLQEAMEGTWNEPRFDADTKRNILQKLAQAELFEKFLQTKFVGQKRFSLEGAETLIVLLDGLVEEGSELGAEEVVIGMPHRGRLNTLVNVLQKKLEFIFAEFDDNEPVDEVSGSGDVKYHKGYSSDRVLANGRSMHLSLTFNPSHLEAVNPVVEGNVRAKQDRRGDTERRRIIPVLLHGDAAFTGQGLVQETLNLSQLSGYATGGTIHIIVNNQIGFTTSPEETRSFLYASDICKMLNAPVLHVNGDDPEAALHAIKLAVGFRQAFNKDVVIDLICYRRHGHNETDEPSFTQPLMYSDIRNHASTLELYAQQLMDEGVIAEQQVGELREAYNTYLNEALETTREENIRSVPDTLHGVWEGLERGLKSDGVVKRAEPDVLRSIGETLSTVPEDFAYHPRLKRLVETRARMAAGEQPLDWGMAELLSYGSLLWEGYHVRISGQDSARGTFSHRHAKLVNVETGAPYYPLQHLKADQGMFAVYDSPLSEAGVLGFEFGYSLADPFCLTVWEAQFGDFCNGAQVIIDQFITSSEEKWLRMSGLVMLLPHGYEGMGPEHSSARLERFLQACADNNIQVCNVTTPAQVFHMFRRQLMRNFRKPLVVMSPKSLLRHPRAVSSLEELTRDTFYEVLDDPAMSNGAREKVRRAVLCSGKVYYDMLAGREERGGEDVALVRLEQLYPFPAEAVSEVLGHYPNVEEVVWVQEEPQNMGAWSYVEPRLREMLAGSLTPRYIGRKAAASPATGSHSVHDQEQKTIVEQSLS